MTAKVDATALREVVMTGDDAKVIAHVASLGATERAAAARLLKDWTSAGTEEIRETTVTPDGMRSTTTRWRLTLGGSVEAWQAADLALTLCAPARADRLTPAQVVAAARALGAEWTRRYADAVLSERPRWEPIRSLVAAGLLPYERQENYLLGMLGGLTPYQPKGPQIVLSDALRADPGVLEREFWDLLELEGTAQESFANTDKYRRGESWEVAVVRLAAEDALPRQRLLDALLRSLAADFVQFRAGWFSRTHDALAPTADEIGARSGIYLRLLGSRVPPTVSMALRCLETLDGAGRLDADEFLAAAETPVRAAAKGVVTTTLRIADGIARRAPSHRGRVARLGVAALLNPAADVQRAALGVIERHGTPLGDELRAEIEPYVEAVAPSLRERVRKLAATATPAAPAAVAEPRRMPVDVAPTDPSRAVVPVASFEELVALAARMLETWDVESHEILIDGFARFGPPSTEAEIRLTRPLAKRAADVVAGHLRRGCRGCIGGTTDVLTAAWADGTPWSLEMEFHEPHDASPRDRYWYRPGTEELARIPRANPGAPEIFIHAAPHLAFPIARLRALASVFTDGPECRSPTARRRLRSIPTHRGGWIDPVVLVARVLGAGTNEPPLLDDDHDRVLALLRLAPHDRAAALARLDAAHPARGESQEFVAALRHALGAPGVRVGDNEGLWIAAARARAPLADDPVVAAKFPASGPDGAFAARYELPPVPLMERETSPYKHAWSWVQRTPWPPRPVPSLHAAVLLHSRADGSADTDLPGDLIVHLATIWPATTRPLCATGLGTLLGSGEKAAQVPAWMSLLDRPDLPAGRRWADPAPELLAAGLGAPEAAVVQAATDVLVDVAAPGPVAAPLPPERLARAIQFVLAAEIHLANGLRLRVPLRRFAGTLGAAARISPAHAGYVAAVIAASLGGLTEACKRDLSAWIELLHECLVTTGGRITDGDVRARLEAIRSGKAGAAAKATLSL